MEKINIWGEQIPFNSSRSKLGDMDIDMEEAGEHDLWWHTMKFGTSLASLTIPEGSRRIMDTYTYVCEISRGYEKETYEDVPYIVPWLAENSDKAVIVVPGGGFGYKSSDTDQEGQQYEGDLVAQKLNAAGISAFVFWYRSNPYRMPVPLLDMQRAIRYVRSHAAEFGLNPDKIGIMGFSAGGYECAGAINLMRNKPVVCDGYVPDETDAVSDRVALAGLIYPCVTFRYNAPVLCGCFDPSETETQEDCEKLIKEYDCTLKVEENDPPQFICFGTDDHSVDPRGTEAYAAKLEEKGVPYEILRLEGADHGFGACDGPLMEMAPQYRKYAYWLDNFTEWANRVFDAVDK